MEPTYNRDGLALHQGANGLGSAITLGTRALSAGRAAGDGLVNDGDATTIGCGWLRIPGNAASEYFDISWYKYGCLVSFQNQRAGANNAGMEFWGKSGAAYAPVFTLVMDAAGDYGSGNVRNPADTDSLSLVNSNTIGAYINTETSTKLSFGVANTNYLQVGTNRLSFKSTAVLEWFDGTIPTGVADTTILRSAAGVLAIGAAVTDVSKGLEISASNANVVGISIKNSSTSSATAHGRLTLANGGTGGGDAFVLYTSTGLVSYAAGIDRSDNDTWKVSVSNNLGTADALAIQTTGSIVLGNAALSTNATTGFLYVPTCAGTPTGTPTAFTGRAPIIINTTNNKLYFYSTGAWRDAGP